MLSPAQAEAAIREHVIPLPAEPRSLYQLAGAVLRESVRATRDQPPFDRVTMDGIALSSGAYDSGRRAFRIASTQAAGAPPQSLADPSHCIEVMTGAALPRGCDCVVPVERISIRDGLAHLSDDIVPSAGLNVHPRGLDCRQDDLLLRAGTRLAAPEIAVLASTGLAQARVSRMPRIIVISTGDELVEPGEAAADWQIHRSNAFAVLSALQLRGFGSLAQDHLPDDLSVLRQRLRAHLDQHDVLILSGGVSMGKFDFVPQVLGELGVRMVFHKIDQRPGKPMWFGVGAGGKTVYALPGNPVSTLVCLRRYALPGLDAAMAASTTEAETVALGADFEVKPALTFFLPVKLVAQPAGGFVAQPCPTRGSGDFTSLIGTDGFVELPPGPRVCRQGETVTLYRW